VSEIRLEAATLPMIYKCSDCGAGHQFKDMIQHKAGCVHYE